MRPRIIVYFPLIVALGIVFGIFLGQQMSSEGTVLVGNTALSNSKINQVIRYIESDYVDTVTEEMLVEETISEMLQNLDPHSYYIPGNQYNQVNDPLEGNFEGIGIEFRIQNDTVVVVQPIGGGPSEQVGLMAGDRIVKVEGENITGEISNSKVTKLLKGPKGTTVNIGVKRLGEAGLIDFSITRDKIPLYSVESAYMLDDQIGYIKVIRFAKNTYQEFMEAVEKLKADGMQSLILDLRNNGGGYLTSATKMADEFLSDGKMIVYTQGKARDREEYLATKRGELENSEVVILINEASASASEIVAGALQDNDRGTILGRRSFGKGLVQEGIQWPDGSAMRLTVARYFTPTGRSIQKPYGEGADAYHEETYNRYENGELLSVDSIQFPDSLKFTTPAGKIVYGGGGIMPDVFIPIDTTETSSYFGKLNYRGMFYQFGFNYVDHYRDQLNETYDAHSFIANFKIEERMLREFYDFAAEKGVDFDEAGAKVSKALIANRLKAAVGRNVWGNDIFYEVVNQRDETVNQAIDQLTASKKGS